MVQKSNQIISPIRKMAAVMITALLIQFLLGMYTNLFIAIPRTTMHGRRGGLTGMGRMMSAGISDPLFMIHMILGILLALGAIATVIVAIGTKQPPPLIIAIVGLISVLIAGYAGLTFFMNGHHNGESYTMALGWVSAFTAYFIGF